MGGHRLLFPVTPELLGQLITNGEHQSHYRIENGVPEDAHFCGAWWDYDTATFILKYEHPDFPLVEEGGIIPRQVPTITLL